MILVISPVRTLNLIQLFLLVDLIFLIFHLISSFLRSAVHAVGLLGFSLAFREEIGFGIGALVRALCKGRC